MKGISKEEFVIETLRSLVGGDVQFKNLGSVLSRLKEDMPEKIIKREIRVALVKDVVKHLKLGEMEKFLEEAIEFIMSELYGGAESKEAS